MGKGRLGLRRCYSLDSFLDFLPFCSAKKRVLLFAVPPPPSSFAAKKKTSDFPPVLRRELFFGKQKVSARDEEGKGPLPSSHRGDCGGGRAANEGWPEQKGGGG